jgi:hypothetical protein
MIQRLTGQGARLVLIGDLSFGVIHAIGILHQGIKTAPSRPGAKMAIGGKGDADDAGVKCGQCLWREAMAGNGAGAITLQENIGARSQITQPRLVMCLTQIKRGCSFAAPGIHHQFIEARQMPRADMQHLRAMRGHCAPGNRPGDNAREI